MNPVLRKRMIEHNCMQYEVEPLLTLPPPEPKPISSSDNRRGIGTNKQTNINQVLTGTKK